MKRIGLCMIVKDEAHIIRRCLESARPLLDYALIVDTGSSDATIDVVSQTFRDLALDGAVMEHPWRDFAYNRSFALARLRERADIDYALMIDADDRVECVDGFDAARLKSRLEADVYNVTTRMGSFAYQRPQLISNRRAFYFKGVLHEFLENDEPFSQAPIEDFFVVSVQDGARSQHADKFSRDAAVLERALETETDAFLRARYTFYLAQCHRDGGEAEKSVAAYLRRADMGFWDEEVFCSLYYAAQQMEALGRGFDEVARLYERASAACPRRAEALHAASLLCRRQELYQRGREIAERGLALTAPPDGLFVEPWIYAYGLRDEFAVNAYWAGEYRACLDVCLELLESPALPADYRPRIAANARFALGHLLPPPIASPTA